ncbi:MAG: S9 family peptidase [Planctomycetes bacterium]|nr:S9 family peptidase [Planctomycetota bacterium]
MKSFAPPFRLAVFCVALVLATPLAAQEKKTSAWTPMQSMQVKRIGGVRVSPDGKRVVYTVREALLEKGKSEYLTHIFVVNADGSGTTQLTQGAKSCDEPQWSPDGKWIAFISKKGGKANLWTVPADGGEALQATKVATAVTSYKWSPDSRWLAYTATDGPTPAEEKAKKEKNDARIVDENIKMSRLHIVTAPPTQKTLTRLLTPGNYNVPPSGRGGYDWSPDGKTIAFTRTSSPHADDWPSAHIFRVNVATGSVTPYATSRAAEYAPHYSPDGKWLAFVSTDDPPTWGGTGRVLVSPANGGLVRRLAETFDGFGRYSEIIGWAADGQSVLFTEMNGTSQRLMRLPLKGDPTVIAEKPGVAPGGFNLTSGKLVGFAWESLHQPPEAYHASVDRFEPKVVSHANGKTPQRTFGNTELVRWKSKDGLQIEGLLTYPANYKKGQRYPLLLNVHGGPMGVFTQTYVGSPGLYPIASFSSRGYAVLRANPRGSSGYSKKFRYANYGDWGGGDYQDLMAGVDHVIKMGVADEKRLGVMGWSYGGYMTSWIITKTNRFKAASVGAGVTNLMSFSGTADIPSFLPDYFGGEFWDRPDVYRKHSAMFNIKGVRTPTLIQHGERDERVPLSQGLELYNALKRQGCPTRMVIYPRTPHGIQEPRLLIDCMERNLDWFDRNLGSSKH